MNGEVTADWEYVRETANHYSNAPVSWSVKPVCSRTLTHINFASRQVTSVTSDEFRCYELDLVNTAGETSTATVSAGDTVGFQANGPIYHPGVRPIYVRLYVLT